MKRKAISILLSAIMLCAVGAGCGSASDSSSVSAASTEQNSQSSSSTDEESSTTDDSAPKTLVTAVGAELNTLYPLNMDPQNNIGTKLCYEGLVNYQNGEIMPGLAESWSFDDDGKKLTFKLREGVLYHDGTALNAQAVKTVYDFAKQNPNFSGIAAMVNLQSIDVVDEYSVAFNYNTPYYAYLSDFCYPEVMIVVAPSAIEDGNFQSMKGVIGTGPYIYEEIIPGESVRFVKNENYWGEEPYYDEVIVKYIPESSARLQSLQNGEIDMIYGSALISWDDYDQAIQLPNVEGTVSPSDSETRNLVLNAAGTLDDLKLREAVAYAIDKQAISTGLTYGYEAVADKLFPSDTPYTDGALSITRGFDIDKANSLLDEAGWTLNQSTGIREKDGKSLTLKYTYDSGEVMNKPIATAIKSQLAAVGIDVQTEGQEMMAWWQEGLAGNYDITMWNTEQPYTSPHNFFIPMNERSPHHPSLEAIDGSAQFRELIVKFQTSDDPEEVQQIFDQILNFDNDNVLDLPVIYVKDMILYNTDKIAGYNFTSTPMFFDITQVQPAQ